MNYSYYPGCSLSDTALDYDRSVRAVCARLGLGLVDIPDWNCCGASSAHMTSHEIGMRLPLRNLLLAAELGHDVLVPCAACFQRLKAAERSLRADPGYWDVPADLPEFRIVHISSLLSEPQHLASLGEQVRLPLEGLSLACYYGCLSLRHPKITGARNYEQPRALEEIIGALGANAVSWSHRTECCSGSLTMARPDIAEALVGDIVAAARRAGAQALVTDCPMCQANVESRQRHSATQPGLPVFFATELIVAALDGSYPASQGRLHLVSAQVLSNVVKRAAEQREEAA
ncbi:CoB--CoM heterodisulfide reductase iron-sulfur subunit B family protein [Desulfofustis glycolicus]|uniref:Heterodisulfide reductase subunit B n=1 Tax=Desulfofustis glycolicus DSM 9705 TaxID=1121409 RepID=A0A1M5TPD6_9BACT|nr:heterodisulfide reductase-related iron-sulfur binding cluster [Desulfofustis glycolicus]SHH52612.1 heterodisulfide reductase subunit B [Desulfofustis glycolicus DSM 9705]